MAISRCISNLQCFAQRAHVHPPEQAAGMHATLEAQKHVTSILQTSSPLGSLRAFQRHGPQRKWQQQCRASLKDDLAEVGTLARTPCASPVWSSNIDDMLPIRQTVT